MAEQRLALRVARQRLPGLVAGQRAIGRLQYPASSIDDYARQTGMQAFVIEGGRPLSGTVRAAGNKNGALPILAATACSPTAPVELRNVPRIRDVADDARAAAPTSAPRSTGPARTRSGSTPTGVTRPSSTRSCAAGSAPRSCSPARCSRASVAPIVPPPGGDVIGRRRLDPHIHALRELGAEIESNGRYEMSAPALRGQAVFLDEASVMATENAVMAAVLAEGETVIGNAACEPHVQDLCRFLVSLGARIEGIGSNVLRIEGVERLRGGEWRDRPRPHRGRQLHRPRGRDRRRPDDRGRRAARPGLDPARLRAARRPRRGGRDDACASRRTRSS